MKEDDKTLDEFRDKFHSMPRHERELVTMDIIKGVHSLSGALLNASTNDTFMTILSLCMDEYVVDTEILDHIVKVLKMARYPSMMAEAEIISAKEIDVDMHRLCRNVDNSYEFVRSQFNRVLLYKTNGMDAEMGSASEFGTVINVDFKNKKKRKE